MGSSPTPPNLATLPCLDHHRQPWTWGSGFPSSPRLNSCAVLPPPPPASLAWCLVWEDCLSGLAGPPDRFPKSHTYRYGDALCHLPLSLPASVQPSSQSQQGNKVTTILCPFHGPTQHVFGSLCIWAVGAGPGASRADTALPPRSLQPGV